MAFGDLTHQLYPLLHQSDAAADPSSHIECSAEKLMNVWKESLKEYGAVLVTKYGNQNS
jgi:hypothetical protein